MADKLNVEQPPAGMAQVEDQAALAAQQPAPPIVTSPDLPAISALDQGQAPQSASASTSQQPAPVSAPVKFNGPTGILQAPAALQQPMKSDVERDQEIQMMWNVMATHGGSALTRLVTDSLSGVN